MRAIWLEKPRTIQVIELRMEGKTLMEVARIIPRLDTGAYENSLKRGVVNNFRPAGTPLSRELVRQIERKAIRHLLHPSRKNPWGGNRPGAQPHPCIAPWRED